MCELVIIYMYLKKGTRSSYLGMEEGGWEAEEGGGAVDGDGIAQWAMSIKNID